MAKENSSFAGLAESISKTISKRFKDGDISILQSTGTDLSHSNVTDWISSGCQMLDLGMSNLPDGGFPCGRISVLYGPQQSGKSMFIAHAIADTQRRGGIGIYIDSEHAMHEGFFNAIGVDTKATDGSWIYTDEIRLEVVLVMIEQFITEIRKHDKDILITIGLDSIEACKTEDELAGDFSLKGYNTSKARILSDSMSRINTLVAKENVCLIIANQVKYKMDVKQFENPWRMPGGQSIPHYASVIIQLKQTRAIMTEINGIKRNVGRYGEAIIEKNRLGPPYVKIKFYIYYDRGVDNLSSYLDYMALFKIGKQSGAWFEYTMISADSGEEIKIREKGKTPFIRALKSNPEVKEDIWKQICDNFIMAYSVDSESIDHSELTFENDPDDDDDE